VRDGYKLRSVMNGMSIVPRKWWPGPTFIAYQDERLVIYSLITVGLYYRGSGHLAESPSFS
jgi:hypothetical protein